MQHDITYLFFYIGTSFAEALGMCTIPQSSKKRNNNLSNLNPSKSIKTEQTLSPIKNQKISVKIEPEDDVQPNVTFFFTLLFIIKVFITIL